MKDWCIGKLSNRPNAKDSLYNGTPPLLINPIRVNIFHPPLEDRFSGGLLQCSTSTWTLLLEVPADRWICLLAAWPVAQAGAQKGKPMCTTCAEFGPTGVGVQPSTSWTYWPYKCQCTLIMSCIMVPDPPGGSRLFNLAEIEQFTPFTCSGLDA